MKLSKHIHIQQEDKGETWYVTLQALECSLEQATGFVNKIADIPVVSPAVPSNKMTLSTVDRANWSVNFTFKSFPSIDEVKAFLKDLPKNIATATGNENLDDVI